MSQDNAQPIFDPATHYRIELKGPLDVGWLQSFDIAADISAQDACQKTGIILLSARTDQSGLVGLVRILHGLGITILRIQIVPDTARATGVHD
jgi:hypothetical protein